MPDTSETQDDFVCEFCQEPQDTLYEGWFRTAAAFNPFASGTVSAGVFAAQACLPIMRRASRQKQTGLCNSGS